MLMYDSFLLDSYRTLNVLVKILELPYEGKELSMLICLPMEIEDGTTGLEKVGTVQRGTRGKKNDQC